jgi:hypothetical protein
VKITGNKENMSILKSNYVVYAYLLNAIDLSIYGVEKTTPFNTLKSLKEIIKKEMQVNLVSQAVLKNYLQGLPSSISIAFEYSEITQKLQDFGIINSKTPQSKIDKIVNNWFGVISFRLLQLFELKENHKFFEYLKELKQSEFETNQKEIENEANIYVNELLARN